MLLLNFGNLYCNNNTKLESVEKRNSPEYEYIASTANICIRLTPALDKGWRIRFVHVPVVFGDRSFGRTTASLVIIIIDCPLLSVQISGGAALLSTRTTKY